MDKDTTLDNQIVTMNIPLEDEATPPIVETISTSYPQDINFDELAAKKAGLAIKPMSPPINPAGTSAGDEVHGQDIPGGEKKVIPAVKDPNRNEKGQFVPGNTASVGSETNGRPCELCSNHETIMKKANAYLERCNKGVGGKATMPFIEELAIECGVLDTTIVNWAQKKNEKDEPEHPDFLSAYLYVKMYQKLRLQQRALGRYNPTGALSLLKFNHGMIETEKKILAGDKNEPLQIEIIEEKPIPTNE